jgi:uncharacterized protein YjiS (DUF1127 family)
MLYDTEIHTPTCLPGGSPVRSTVGFLCHAQRFLKALDDRRKVRQLYTWSTEELKDIGLSRGDVDREAMKPVRFW